jgi:carboxypeptidase family protein/TonB-dependent receptor-like protein
VRQGRIRPAVMVAAGLIVFTFFSAQLPAQTLYGTLVGNITDPSGLPVEGATVRAESPGTGLARETKTNERGGFLFSDLPPGSYNLTVRADALAPFTTTGLQISANAVTRADAQLELPTVAEAVTVAASAVALQTDRAEVRSELDTRQVNSLPVTGVRNYTALLALVPGVSPPAPAHTLAANPQESLAASVGGQTDERNDTRIDGAGNTFVWLPRLVAYSPPLETIEAVNVVTNSMDAETGMAGGAAINVVTKSGTNRFDGTLFEHHINSALKARNVFYYDPQKPKFLQNQWGGTIGGPIAKNKLFFFGSHERTDRESNVSRFFTVPTLEQRRGDFSSYGTTIYDPLTGNANGSGRTAFPNNIIPADRMSRVARTIIDWLPLPTTSAVSSNYFASGVAEFDRHSSDVKVNWNPSGRLTMFGRASVLKFSGWTPVPFGRASGGAIPPELSEGPVSGLNKSISVGGTYTITPTLLLDGTIGFNYVTPEALHALWGQNVGTDDLGLPGTNVPAGDITYSGMPQFSISGYSTYGNPGAARPQRWHDNQRRYNANISWMKGSHGFRFGFDLSNEHMNHWQVEGGGGPRGAFNYTGGQTAILGGPATNQFNAFAAFLLGLPSSIGKAVAPELPLTTRAWRQGFYARDQWQATRDLTLTLGVRAEYYPIVTRKNRGVELYDIATNTVRIGGVGSVPLDVGTSESLQFAPRLGAAYRIGDKWVVRGGFGISTDPFSLARLFRTNYPSLVVMDIVAPNSFGFVGKTEDGIPPVPIPDLGNGIIAIPGNVAATAMQEEFNRGYTQSYNVTVQRELNWGFVAQAGYVGSRTVRPLLTMELNYALPGGGNTGRILNQRYGRTAGTTLQLPYEDGTGRYDSLQATLNRRFRGGFQLQTSYTFSKSMSWATSWMDPSQFDRNRALSSFDRPHNFQMGWVAELPFGEGKPLATEGLAKVLFGGWQLNGIFSKYSGTPFTVTASGTSLNAPGNAQTADQVLDEVKILGGTGPGQSYFDPLAFRSVTDVRYGNVGLNSLRGPGFTNLDLGLFREFRVHNLQIQFRAEAFNATNTPHFNNPGNNVSNMRLNADGTVNTLGGFTEITSARADERQVRLGFRVAF